MIWKRAVHLNFILPDFKVFGWKENGKLLWMDEPFPNNIEEIIFDSRYHDQYDYHSRNKSNNELDKFDAFSYQSFNP